MSEKPTNIVLKGGEFLIKDVENKDVFIPEEMNEEQRMVFETVKDFIETEVMPNVQKIEKQDFDKVIELMQKAGDLGLLGTHIPESYGGMLMDANANTAICEAMGKGASFTVAYAAHTGIGMLPILYYGTEEQKLKYLPKLCSGELKASYCLTEPSSGSDALSAKTKATLSDDGKHYVLNGQKMWITNAGFADIFIVFAQVDGDKFTGFVVEKGTPGLTLGAEEDKLGIKGSSTRQVFFENVTIAVENVLGQVGKGHHIAFNVLNIGRFKLGALVMGACKDSIDIAVKYANERHQFKLPISKFGAIQYKLAQQAIKTYSLESAQYRVSEMLNQLTHVLEGEGKDYAQAKLEASEEYAVECAILKVYGSEVVDYVADETLQIHGGNGFSEEFSCARSYRDSRINRIFEGTNEINRLLAFSMLMKRSMNGKIDLVGPAWEVQKELASMPSFSKPDGSFGEEEAVVKNMKKLGLMVAGAAVKYQMDGKINLKHEQEIVMDIADIMIQVFMAESMLLRVMKLSEKGENVDYQRKMIETFLTDALFDVTKSATQALNSFGEGDELRILLMGVKRFTKYKNVNTKAHRRDIAQQMIDANAYVY